MATFNVNWRPNYSASVNRSPRVKKTSFGDGYELRVSDGINTNKESWNLSFTGVTSVIDDIDRFLSEQHGVHSFWWTTPKGKRIAVVCEEWDVSIDNWDWQNLSCKFSQVMEKPQE